MTLVPVVDPAIIKDATLNGQSLSVDLLGSLLSVGLDWYIDQAPTVSLSVQDELRRWVRHPIFTQQCELVLGGVHWLLARIEKQGSVIDLTFEHWVVAKLRHHINPRVVEPGTMSRVDFARELVSEEPGINVIVPFNVNEPLSAVALSRGNTDLANLTGQQVAVTGPGSGIPGDPADPSSGTSTDTGAGIPGATGADGTAGSQAETLAQFLAGIADAGAPANQTGVTPPGSGAAGTTAGTQADQPLPTSGVMSDTQAAEALRQGGFTGDQVIATFVAIGHAESGLKVDAVSPLNNNGSVDRGWLQINSIHVQYDPDRLIHDPVYCAQAAFDISGQGNITGDTGASAYEWTTFDPSPQHPYNTAAYRQYLADGTVAAAASGGTAPSGTDLGQPISGNETAEKPESTWDALQRIFSEVQWRCFIRGADELWLSPDFGLYAVGKGFVPISLIAIQGDPTIGNNFTAVSLTEEDAGVDAIDFSWDVNLRTATATAVVRSELWNLWPGQAVALPDLGVATGTWLISHLHQTLGSVTCDVDFVQPQPALPEPAPQPGDPGTDPSVNVPGSGDPGSTPADTVPPASGSVDGMLAWANSHLGDSYVWGAEGPHQWDCSGFVKGAAASQGVTFPHNSEAILRQCQADGTAQVLAIAVKTKGALLIRKAGTLGAGDSGHISISLGDGRQIGALNTRVGVAIQSLQGWSFTDGAFVPGLSYNSLAALFGT